MSQCDKCNGIGYYDEGHENDDGSMSGGNYVACECEKNKSCTSDEWLTNAAQSTRDLANKIKGQQLRGTGNQFRNETESELHAREIAELKSVLKAANSQTEEFERKWYLAVDLYHSLLEPLKEIADCNMTDFAPEFRNADDFKLWAQARARVAIATVTGDENYHEH